MHAIVILITDVKAAGNISFPILARLQKVNPYLSTWKGKCHEIDIFVEDLNSLVSTFGACPDGFQGLSKAFPYSTKLFPFSFLFWNYLLILKMVTLYSSFKGTVSWDRLHKFDHFMDKNKQITLFIQCKLAFSGRNVLMALKFWRDVNEKKTGSTLNLA